MKVIMDDTRFIDVKQLEAFLQGNQKLAIQFSSLVEKYAFIRKTVKRFVYGKLKRKEKHTVDFCRNNISARVC